MLITSTAGPKRDGDLWQIYQQARQLPDQSKPNPYLTISKDSRNGFPCWWYAAPEHADPNDPGIWRGCNPGSWLNLDDLHRQRHDPAITTAEFRRLNLNQWLDPTTRRHAQYGR